jgi:hypothetical protein
LKFVLAKQELKTKCIQWILAFHTSVFARITEGEREKMKNILTILVLVLLATTLTSCLAVKRVQEAINMPSTGGFVPNLPDVPLPRNFIVDAGTSTFFDSPEGRIAEINAQGFDEKEDIEEFYTDNMKQFGWSKINNSLYKKEGEMLIISIEVTKSITNIKYQLRPAV